MPRCKKIFFQLKNCWARNWRHENNDGTPAKVYLMYQKRYLWHYLSLNIRWNLLESNELHTNFFCIYLHFSLIQFMKIARTTKI